ncbi:hypothetical protein VNO80_14744 [Phaseolus coccineus]|uniref:Uncharacterized protein n=1 Tax=Phaseolus coccineus TaxID=3886 RepID=A0AAN9R6B1_PHACN
MEEIKQRSAQKEIDFLAAMNDLKGKKVKLLKTVDAFQDDVTNSFIIRFGAAKDQVVFLHPSIDLSEMNPLQISGGWKDGGWTLRISNSCLSKQFYNFLYSLILRA